VKINSLFINKLKVLLFKKASFWTGTNYKPGTNRRLNSAGYFYIYTKEETTFYL